MTIVPFSADHHDIPKSWGVALVHDGAEILIPCLDEVAAIELAHKLANAIAAATGVPHKVGITL